MSVFEGNFESLIDALRQQFQDVVDDAFRRNGLSDLDENTKEFLSSWLVDCVAPTIIARRFDDITNDWTEQLDRCIAAQVLRRLERDNENGSN